MVKGLLLLLLLPQLVLAGTSRTRLQLAATQIEQGDPLRGTLLVTGNSAPPTLNALRPLEADFAVIPQGGWEDVAASQGHHSYRLVFNLYAKHTGHVVLPRLAVAGASTKPVVVTVTPAMARGGPIEVTQTLSSTRPWVRQQVLVMVEVITPDHFASLQIDRDQLPGFEVTPLLGKSEQVRTPSGMRTLLRAGWAVFALAAGHYRLELPAVKYQMDGGTQRRFPLVAPALDVKALPPYVPPTMPVGRVRIAVDGQPSGVLYPDRLAQWHVTVSAAAVPPSWLPPVVRSVHSSRAVRFLPAQQSLTSMPDHGGIHGRLEYTLPFKPLADGLLRLPNLELQYFDPNSGRLKRVLYHPARLLVLGIVVRLVAGMTLMFLLLWAMYRGWRWGRAMWMYRKACRQALAHMALATDAAAIRAALRHYIVAAGGVSSLSLSACRSFLDADNEMAEALSRLAAASYGRHQDIDLTSLRDCLIQKLRLR